MNSAGKHALAALLAISVAGCAQKSVKTAPPAQAQAPSKDAGKAGALYPPPLVSSQPEAEPAAAPPAAAAQAEAPPPPPEAAPKPKKPASKKPKPSAAKTATPTAAPSAEAGDPAAAPSTAPPGTAPTPAQTEAATQMAAATGEPAAASPIGQLSTGGAAGQSQTHKSTSDLITNTENSVNAIKRALSPQEQETVAQIRTFLTKARQALDNDDFDGASTLATKAKVLLDELNKD